MSISDAIYRPFESLIRPLDIPYRPLPSKGPVTVLLHFISMFRGVLIALALSKDEQSGGGELEQGRFKRSC